MTAGRVIKARDLAPFVCGSGMKNFCKATGLSYMTLVREGYPVETLLSFDDVNCADVVSKFLNSQEAKTDGQ